MSTEHILVVDDEPDIRNLIGEILEDEGYRVTMAADAVVAREAVSTERPDLVLLDIWLPDTDGISLLKEWSTGGHTPMPVVMISGHGTVETAVEATRLGAYDFIEKPVSMAKLLVTIKRALQAEQLARENLQLRRGSQTQTTLIGDSDALHTLRQNIKRVAATDAWVLITGEAGSGKAVVARALHAMSARNDRPMIEMNLGAIPRENVAIQLFGSETGGELVLGSFEQASGGTLLLDEVADLDPAAQTQLINVLEEGRFMRVGGKQAVPLDVRIIAATHQDLSQAVASGRFREDLYYRLNVVPLHVPPLREHPEDIPQLVAYYLDAIAAHEHLSPRTITQAALKRLASHTWPGNIRELKNLLQRLLILPLDDDISADEISNALGYSMADEAASTMPTTIFEQPLRDARDAFERVYLEHNLELVEGNVSAVAKHAGMERTHLYRKLKQLGIDAKHGKKAH